MVALRIHHFLNQKLIKDMRIAYFLLLPLLFACTPAPTESNTDSEEPSQAVAETQTRALPTEASQPEHQQVLLALTPDWETVGGQLYRLEWQEGSWKYLDSEPIPMVVGKNGLAWGRGLEDYRQNAGPAKREGDKKSPAGVFPLGTAFGYAPAEAATFVKASYTPVVASTMCIEDPNSASYNQIVDESDPNPDWNSTDHMRRKDDLYEWGMFVLHNQPEAEAGSGSCIFLHVWRKNDSGTAGCTAMDKAEMKRLLAWIDPAKQAVLMQLPQTAWPTFQQAYALPDLPQ
jgi:D-alanyl-D-alanine dipeptidase